MSVTAVPLALVVETAHDRRSPHRCLAVAVTALVVLGLALLGRGPTAAATPAQEPTPSSTMPAGTVAAVPTTSTPTGPDAGKVAAEDRQIWLVVAGLVAVAVALLLLTIRYWRQTRPVPPLVEAETSVAAAVPGSVAEAGVTSVAGTASLGPGRPSRRAVAGADHAAADDEWEPRATGEHERIDVPVTRRPTRPTVDQRTAALRAASPPR